MVLVPTNPLLDVNIDYEIQKLTKKAEILSLGSKQGVKRTRKGSLINRIRESNKFGSRHSGGAVEGDLILADFRKLLSCFKTRTKQQVLFHEAFIQANLKNMYGDDYPTHELRIKKEHLADNLNQFVLISCPRRYGKTVATAMFGAAALIAFPHLQLILFSPSKRQSKMLSDKIKEYVMYLGDNGFDFDPGNQNNQEVFSIVRDGSERTVMNLGSNPETSRGVGGHMVFCDEAASLSVEFLLKVIMPLLQLDRTSFIGISTVKNSENYFSKLQTLVNRDGSSFFNLLKFYNVCESCRKKDQTEQCSHHKHLLPHWISAAKLDQVKFLYEQLGAIQALKEELGGMVTNALDRAFESKAITHMFDKRLNPPVVAKPAQKKMVFISLDPTGGSMSNSALAMISAYYVEGRCIIVGIENMFVTRQSDYMPYIKDHVNAIRGLSTFQDCVLAFIIENDMRIQAIEVMEMLQKEFNFFYIINKEGYELNTVRIGTQSGVSTGAYPMVKEELFKNMSRMLNFNQIKFGNEIVSTYNPKNLSHENHINDLKKEFKRQMGDYGVQHVFNKNDPNAPVKRSYGGKAQGPDDLCMALQLNTYWANNFIYKHAGFG